MFYFFWLLPLTFYLGTAGQALGVYAFALVGMGWCCLSQKKFLAKESDHLFFIGCLLLGFYIVFPAANVLSWFFRGDEWNLSFSTQQMLRFSFGSQVSSSFFIVGMALMGLSKIKFLNEASFDFGRAANASHKDAFDLASNHFLKGLTIATVLFFIYALIQNVTGFDPRSPNHVLHSQHQLSSGLYRVFGFYGHPLSLASVGLAFFVFATSMLTSLFQRGIKNIWKKFCWITIALLNLYFVFASNGRTAILIALCFFISVIFRTKQLGIARYRFQIVSVGLVMVAVLSWWAAGRYQQIWSESLPDRVVFWKVHWELFLESPWIGQGHKWLDLFLREQYYQQHGMAGLKDKFNAHNLYLEILANCGLLGFSWLAISVEKLRKRLRSLFLECDGMADFSKAFFLAVLANLIHGFTQETFFDSNVTAVYLGLLLTGLWLQHLLLGNGQTAT